MTSSGKRVEMAKLIITRGLPASGKSTRARAWVTEDPAQHARVNRDDLRAMAHDSAFVKQSPTTAGTERQIIAIRDAAITALLGRGVDVVCDDTNLPNRVARDLRRLAVLAQAEFEVWDLTDVPYATCMSRNDSRKGNWPPNNVPDEVLYDMYMKYVRGKPYPLPLPEEPADVTGAIEPYVPVPGSPKAIMVDLDGTAAIMCGRSPYDETRVSEDRPNPAVIAAVEAMAGFGYRVIFCSGRTEACREATELWLDDHVGVYYDALHMRPAGDGRKDAIVKREIFDREIRDKYDVVAVFDDRATVVAMWRSLGLTVFAVAEGNF